MIIQIFLRFCRAFPQRNPLGQRIKYAYKLTTGGIMARRKRNSATLEQTERRIESLRSISETLDLGGGLTLAAYTDIIDDLRTKLAAYNTALSTLDKLMDDVKEAERAAKEIAEKMLLGVGSRYGRNSQEYEMAGGSRRKNSRRLAPTVPANDFAAPSRFEPIASTNGATNGVPSQR